jgi:hypothetical protein
MPTTDRTYVADLLSYETRKVRAPSGYYYLSFNSWEMMLWERNRQFHRDGESGE